MWNQGEVLVGGLLGLHNPGGARGCWVTASGQRQQAAPESASPTLALAYSKSKARSVKSASA